MDAVAAVSTDGFRFDEDNSPMLTALTSPEATSKTQDSLKQKPSISWPSSFKRSSSGSESYVPLLGAQSSLSESLSSSTFMCSRAVGDSSTMGSVASCKTDQSCLRKSVEGSFSPAVQRGLSRVSRMVDHEGDEVVVDEHVKAVVSRETVHTWCLPGAGVYHLRITRASGVTAWCNGNASVLQGDTGEVLWQLHDWSSSEDGVEENFCMTVDEGCMLKLVMRAQHVASSWLRAGRSLARVQVTWTASFVKRRPSSLTSSSSGPSRRAPRSSIGSSQQSRRWCTLARMMKGSMCESP